MRLILRLFVLLIFGFTGYANAGVILTGTRIIYPEGAKDKTLQLTNQSLSLILYRYRLTMERRRVLPRL